MTQNKKHKQTLESAQYGLEISFKTNKGDEDIIALVFLNMQQLRILVTGKVNFCADNIQFLRYYYGDYSGTPPNGQPVNTATIFWLEQKLSHAVNAIKCW